MAILEKEQAHLRALFLKTKPDSTLPLNILPPFCLLDEMDSDKKPMIGALENCNGWVIRTVTGLTMISSQRKCEFLAYPQLPSCECFILGYAGEKADDLISGFTENTPFSVNVWYFATMAVSIEYRENVLYSSIYECTRARWKKALRE